MAHGLSEEFDTHFAIVAFSPTGAPTVDFVLRTYLPVDAPPPYPPSSGAETAGEAATRVVGMRREAEETKELAVTEWARVAAAMKVRVAQASMGKRNWWEVDAGGLGEEELPVFIRAEVQGRIDAMASAQLLLSWKKKKL